MKNKLKMLEKKNIEIKSYDVAKSQMAILYRNGWIRKSDFKTQEIIKFTIAETYKLGFNHGRETEKKDKSNDLSECKWKFWEIALIVLALLVTLANVVIFAISLR